MTLTTRLPRPPWGHQKASRLEEMMQTFLFIHILTHSHIGNIFSVIFHTTSIWSSSISLRNHQKQKYRSWEREGGRPSREVATVHLACSRDPSSPDDIWTDRMAEGEV
ncbi:hypothetical protein TNCV_2422341 [Trichonephila clavipes]|nr:hypothetical protein TNCV_2422341 [Trichonephila clavipes]